MFCSYRKKKTVTSEAFAEEDAIKIEHKETDSSGKTGKVKKFVKPHEILYVQKIKRSVSVQITLLDGKTVLKGVSGTLTEWMTKLPLYFIQIHKSHFVNLLQAQSIHPHRFQKEVFELSFKCLPDKRLTIGEHFYDELVKHLQSRN